MSCAWLIRHAETEMAGRFCGHSDPELNDRGRAQLAGLAERFSTERIEKVYSSDLRRASSTARAIAAVHQVPVEVRPALREIDFGHWEGLRWEEIEQNDREYADRWMAAFPSLAAPAGEDFRTFAARVMEELKQIFAQQPGPIAVVTHAGVLRVVLRELCGFSEPKAWEQTQSYGCVVRYEFRGTGGQR